MFFRSTFLSPDPAPATSAAPPAVAPVPPEQKVNALTTQLIAQHGTIENALRALVLQSVASEQELGTLRAQVGDYKTKLPDGAIVLTKDAAANWTKLQDLKLSPEQVATAVKERDELKGTVAKHAAEVLHRSIAEASGLDPEAWTAHALRANLTGELKDVQAVEHGKTVTKKAAVVRSAVDEKATPKPVSDYVQALPAFEQRALKPTAATPTGTPYITQTPTPSTGSPTDPVTDAIAKWNTQAANRPNPLVPKPQTVLTP